MDKFMVKNAKGTANASCACGTWLKHWEQYSGMTSDYCQADGCISKDVIGAHVLLANGSDGTLYIYPLCKACNQKEGEFLVSATYKLVYAKVRACAR